MSGRIIILIFIAVCALSSGAQTLTATYVQLADSADYYIRHERWDDAERAIVAALRHEPANKSNYLLWGNLGVIRTNRGDNDGALQAFEIGLASAPRSTTLLTNRARTYLTVGDAKNALADLDAALANDSTLQWARKMRGIVRATSDDFDGARSDFSFYTARFGDDSSVLETEGDMLMAEGKAMEAVEKYRSVYARDHEQQLLVKALATAWSAGKLSDYEEDIYEGLRRFPTSGNLYLMRAMLNKEKFQNSACERDLATALELGADRDLYQTLTRTIPKK